MQITVFSSLIEAKQHLVLPEAYPEQKRKLFVDSVSYSY
jgi:hypothetical protein